MSSIFLHVEAFAGTDISDVAFEAQALAEKLQLTITFKFNGVNCMAQPAGDAELLATRVLAELSSIRPYKYATSAGA